MLPNTQRNRFQDNIFLDNGEQINVAGGGDLMRNAWAVDGRGNYWSDYAGFDADGDAIGDLPYASQEPVREPDRRPSGVAPLSSGPGHRRARSGGESLPDLSAPAPDDRSGAADCSRRRCRRRPACSAAADRVNLAVAAGMMVLALAILVLLACVAASTPTRRSSVHLRTETWNDTMIAFTDLTKRYGKFTAVDDLTLQVPAAGSGGAVGRQRRRQDDGHQVPAGAAALQRADHASTAAMCAGRDAPPASCIGYVPQELAFYKDMTHAGHGALLCPAEGRAAPRASHRCWHRSGWPTIADKPVGALSGGMKQRLALGLALLADPPVLVMDEPTSNLDTAARSQLLQLLVQVKAAGKTIIFTSHRIEEVEALADRVAVMERGRAAVYLPGRRAGRAPRVCAPRSSSWCRAVSSTRRSAMLHGDGLDGATQRRRRHRRRRATARKRARSTR